jgi:hypothetical protein
MEPFSKDDPLHKLLGKSRAVEPRPNFTQNVLRAVRQEPQKVGFWERCRAWLEEEGGFKTLCQGTVAAAAVLTLSLVVWKQAAPATGNPADVVMSTPPAGSPPAPEGVAVETTGVTEMPVEVVASELENLEHLSVMLAQQDTSAMTDSEIVSLLY